MAFGQYKGRCVGRLMHFLYPISHLFDYNAKFGDGKIYWGFNGPCIATFDWEEDSDFPIVDFIDPDFKKRYHDRFVHEKECIRELERKINKTPWSKKAEEEKVIAEREARRAIWKQELGL